MLGLPNAIRACLFDLDGVLTQTAKIHAAAWKEMFDAFLRERAAQTGESFEPFDPVADYDEYVDGKPRYDGVRSFLAARGIALPEGTPDDPPDAATVHGIGNRFAVGAYPKAGLIRQGEIRELEHELAVGSRWKVRLDNDCLPTRRPAITTRCSACSQLHARLGVLPNRISWLDHQPGIETSLLVRRRSEVIVREHGPKRAIDTAVVKRVIRIPALHRCLGSGRAEERMVFDQRTRERSVALVSRLAQILSANRIDALNDFFRRKGSVFVVEAVTRSV